ncbi:type II toxin-antitoxin system RelB/DinJ family antitoxin [Methylophilus sp. 13]|uniref:type II toxin-antitoxin system RelB/DinJ family antitoxin n=1 Tax=Methylophilus sp. 13 TaxID=2781018 RepID=UPI00188E8339|nr:type II toxin-antitoxin system RelB/DinJ family antitoxin [Methylophilus sp. 13]MBF5040337.1 type II toxin-antitoxin system RelB/DinJ family antitoxin [Methylophilus sp. 13]
MVTSAVFSAQIYWKNKEETINVLSGMDWCMSDVIRMLLTRVAIDRALTIDVNHAQHHFDT